MHQVHRQPRVAQRGGESLDKEREVPEVGFGVRGIEAEDREQGQPEFVGPLDGPLEVLPLGQSELVKDGRDLLFAVGNTVGPAVEAARELEKDGLSFAVVNARFVKPLDRAMILRFAGPGRAVVTLEDGIIEGGAGSAVRELLDREGRFDLRFLSIGLPVGPYPLGKTEEIRAALGLDVPGIARRIREFVRTLQSRGGDERTRG